MAEPALPTRQEEIAAFRDMHVNAGAFERAAKATEDRPWLNQIDLVNGIVRNFMHQVLSRLGEVAAAKGEGQEAAFDWVAHECGRLNTAFLGYDPEREHPRYTLGLWNTPGQLGSFVRKNIPQAGEDRLAVRDAFAGLVEGIMETMANHGDQPVEEWGWELEVQADELARILMGFPPTE